MPTRAHLKRGAAVPIPLGRARHGALGLGARLLEDGLELAFLPQHACICRAADELAAHEDLWEVGGRNQTQPDEDLWEVGGRNQMQSGTTQTQTCGNVFAPVSSVTADRISLPWLPDAYASASKFRTVYLMKGGSQGTDQRPSEVISGHQCVEVEGGT